MARWLDFLIVASAVLAAASAHAAGARSLDDAFIPPSARAENADRALRSAQNASQIAPQTATMKITLTQEQAAAIFQERALAIPHALLAKGIKRIGDLNLETLQRDFTSIGFELDQWTEAPNAVGGKRYMTRFTHGRQLGSNHVYLNGQLWFLADPVSQAEIALNAVLSALGYNDAFYQMTSLMWLLTQDQYLLALSSSEYRTFYKRLEHMSRRLPDRGDQPEDPSDPYGSQLPEHYGKFQITAPEIFRGASDLHAEDITVIFPGRMLADRDGKAAISLEPYIPDRALNSGGGDFGSIFFKRINLKAGAEDTLAAKANGSGSESESRLMFEIKMLSALPYEFNWKTAGPR